MRPANANPEMTHKAASELSVVMPHRVKSVNSGWGDWLGITASIGCAIHCAAMPLVFAYLPAFGLSFLADPAFHKWMVLICFLIAIAAFVPGIRRHGNWLPVSVASFGLAFITVAAFGFAGFGCASCEPSDPGAGTNSATVATVSIEDVKETFGDAAEPISVVPKCETCGVGIDERIDERIDELQPPTESVATVESKNSVNIVPTDDSGTNWLLLIAPWITPFGGLLLVAAHLMNRRCGCSCGRCH